MKFDVVTVFPRIFDSYLGESLLKRAQTKKLLRIRVWNLRDFAKGRHKKVDDRPFGGGPGMVLQVEPLYKAVRAILKKSGARAPRRRVILFSTRGKLFDAKAARRLARYDELILLCGRYEGVDERVAIHIADEEISIGSFVLSGGELPALVLIEAVSRFLLGFLGTRESLEEIKGSYPVYTRPAVFRPERGVKAWGVPRSLLSGDHAKIRAWRNKDRR